jgi:hypothetical protein
MMRKQLELLYHQRQSPPSFPPQLAPLLLQTLTLIMIQILDQDQREEELES